MPSSSQRSLVVDGDQQRQLQPHLQLQQQHYDQHYSSPPYSAVSSNAVAETPITPSSTSSPQRTVRKQASLARIAVPSFSAFRSQVSSIPAASVNRAKQQHLLPQSSPRHFSFAAEPSPRLVDRHTRPLSLDTIVPPNLEEQESEPHAYHPGAHDRNTSIDSIISDFAVQQEPMNKLKPSMTLEFNGVQRKLSNESLSPDGFDKRPKSPSRIGAFFGWKSASPQKDQGQESPTTTFSDRSLSPGPSPHIGKNGIMAKPAGLDIPRANSDARFFQSPDTPIMIGTPEMNTHVQELERELSHISAELAGSIRREMDLEDEIERMKLEMPSVPPSEMSRRGSDYFSDSGAGSVRYPISDPDAKIEEVERLRRKAEQDKAQMKLDIAQKLQTELAKRRELEEVVQNLEDQLERQSQEDTERKGRRVEELEAQLEDVRRRLNQEKEAKENFEDLYTALQQELTSGRKFGGRGFSSIAEESDDFGPRAGLSRSGSLARSGSKRGGSLNRSGSVKGEGGRQRSGSIGQPLTAESFKEIEDQRDALHKALKLLISRHEKQQREHERHIKKLTRNTQLAANTNSNPQRSGFQREVSVLKEEVTTLRKRTEDALEQKWQYEKSLGGIKMDLDRAEQETRGLRHLLHEHDISAPSPRTMQKAFGAEDETPNAILSAAQTDRDQARRLADEFKHRVAALQHSNAASPQLAELKSAAMRMEQLSEQFDHQVNANTELRDRLAAAVEKGEREQSQSTRQIEEMQKRLAGMEDSLLAAQQHSEHTLSTHETEVRAIEEASSPRLRRFNFERLPEPSKLSPNSPALGVAGRSRSKTVSNAAGLLRSKTLPHKKVVEASLLDASRTQKLERQVRDLERLLRDAEDDMQYVVQRVNRSQLEVAELTNERDVALIQMRKLQSKLVEETERAEELIGVNAELVQQQADAELQHANDSGSDYGD